MYEYLSFILEFNFPIWVYPAFAAGVILLGILLFLFIRTRIFKSRVRKMVKAYDTPQAEEALAKFVKHYPPEKLVRRSRRMERYSRQWGPRIVRETGLADKWINKLAHSPRGKDLRRVLHYCWESSLFMGFLTAEKNPGLRKVFFNWVESEGEEKVIRLLAGSCRGEDFNPDFIKGFLDNQAALLRELTGEPEWSTRYFVYRILLLDKDPITERSIDDGLLDSHTLIRKILTKNITFEDDKTWTVLWDKLTHDPVYEVREVARKRIANEFMDRYNLKDQNLNDGECFHVLEQLDPGCQEDRTFAMSVLENANKELRYPAAAFLEKCGILDELLAKTTLDDPDNMKYSENLLQKALEVSVSGFLQRYPLGDGAPLLTAARLLSGPDGTPDGINYLEEKVFEFFKDKNPDPSNMEIYTRTLEVAASKGNVKAIELFADELSRRENDPVFLELLLPRIPHKAESVFTPILYRFLENTAFSVRGELIDIIGKFSPYLVLPKATQILNADRAEYPHIVRISAFKILGKLHLPFCLQRILESLPTLLPEEAEEFAPIIAGFPQDMFDEKAKALFALPDAKIRAALIRILPTTESKQFLKEIRSSLKDVDPDVRIAAIKALLGFGEIRLLNQETSMLRDPVERVRLATAEVIALHANEAALEVLKNITADPNETDIVKIGVINGLGQSASAEGIRILISVLDSQTEICKYAENALAMRTTKQDIIQLIDIFKDAEPELREKLIPVFKAQGTKAEPWILDILKDEIASLKPYLVQILEETGYVDEAKRRLSHRKADVRREAAVLLSLLDTLSAFRGLVLAAKDPDQEVRVCVVKALERLKTAESHEMLEKLKEDPDNRIRKYTHWALERLESLNLE